MPRYHAWSYPDSNGAKHCLYDGCAVRVRGAYAQWQERKGTRWVSILEADVPACTGLPPKEGR